ncbi:hypothetical protein PRZ48_009556 [Zasmidium cellare]|uniref:NAD(P)-binding protein n=1 Tax=Zasmidium cellare TaxID=395010 RepID=A0ABR0EC22_ZASCE|nr:hypothetical protein PRZ48_009556 [Zasmidium cellare]
MATTISAPLAGKVAIVTGGSRGIGASIARKLAKQGCTHVSITYTSKPEGAQATIDEIHKVNASIKTTAIKADLLDSDFSQKVIKSTLEGLQVDRIDILIINAAVMGSGETKADFDNFIRGNAWVPLELSEAAVPYMPHGGRIVMISSASSKTAMGKSILQYAASKAAMDAISRNLAVVYGPSKGITVNTISVGVTRTDAMFATSDQSMEGMNREGFLQLVSALSTLHRIDEAEEVADIVVFVASPASQWINGNQIPANGGVLSMAQG